MTEGEEMREPSNTEQFKTDSKGGMGMVKWLLVVAVIGFGGMFLYFMKLADSITQEASAEATDGAWDNSLTDFNGMWSTGNGAQIRLFFNRQGSGIAYPDMEVLVTPSSVDRDNGDVTFLRTPLDLDMLDIRRQMGKQMRKELPAEGPSTIRRDWDRAREQFTITMYDEFGTGTSYGFVRRLLPQEEASFANIRERAAAVVQQQQQRIAEEEQATQPNDDTVAELCSDAKTAQAAMDLGVLRSCPPGSPGAAIPASAEVEVDDGSNAKADGYFEEDAEVKPPQ